MPLAASNRSFKRNACLSDGSESQLRARLAARAGRSGAEWGMLRSGSASWNTVVSVRPPWFP